MSTFRRDNPDDAGNKPSDAGGGRRSPFGSRGEDNDNDRDIGGPSRPRSNPFGRPASGRGDSDDSEPRRNPFNRPDSGGGASPSRSPFGSSASARGGSSVGGSDDDGPRRSPFGSSSGGAAPRRTFGSSAPDDDKKDDSGGRTPFGNRPSSSSGGGGSRRTFGSSAPDDDKKDDSGGRTPFGNRPSSSSSGPTRRPPGGKPTSGSSGDDSKRSSFGGRSPRGSDDAGKGGRTASAPSRFRTGSSTKPDDSKNDNRDDKESGGRRSRTAGNRFRDPIGGSGTAADVKDGDSKGPDQRPRPSGSRQTSTGSKKGDDGKKGSRGSIPGIGRRRSDKKDDDKDNKKSGKPDSKSSRKKTDKKADAADASSGGILGRFRRGGTSDDKDKKDKPAKATTAAAKTSTKKDDGNKKKAKDLPSQPRVPKNVTRGLDIDRQLDLLGGGLVLLAALMIFGRLQSALSTTEASGITAEIDILLAQFFGIGRIVLPFAAGTVGAWLIFRHFGRMFDIDYFRIVGALLTFAAFLATLQWFELFWVDFPNIVNYVPTKEALAEQSDTLWQDGGGGGFFGHVLYIWWHRQLGDWVFEIFLVFWWAFGLFFAFDLSFEKIANYIIARRHERQAREAVVVAESAPAPAPAAAGANAVVATTAPSKRQSRRKQKAAEKQRAAGRQATNADGRTAAPTDAPIDADTDGDQPKRAVAEKQGRRTAPTDATIDADTDGDQPKRAPRNLFGRRQRPAESTTDTQPDSDVKADATTAEKAEDKPAQPTRQPRPSVFGRRRTTGSSAAQKSNADKADNQPQRQLDAEKKGRRVTPTAAPAAESSEPSRGGLFGQRGRRQAPDQTKDTQNGTETKAAATRSAGTEPKQDADKPAGPHRAPADKPTTERRAVTPDTEKPAATTEAGKDNTDAASVPARRPAATEAGGRRMPAASSTGDDKGGLKDGEEAAATSTTGRKTPTSSPAGRRLADAKPDQSSTDARKPTESEPQRRSPFGRSASPQPVTTDSADPPPEQAAENPDRPGVAAAATTMAAGAASSGRRPPKPDNQATQTSESTGRVRSPFDSGSTATTNEADKQGASEPAARPSSPFGRRPADATSQADQPAQETNAQPAASRRPSTSPFGRQATDPAEKDEATATPPREVPAVASSAASTAGDSAGETPEPSADTEGKPATPARRPSSPFGRATPAAGAPSPVSGRRPSTADNDGDDIPEEDQAAAAERRRAGRRPAPSPFASMGGSGRTSTPSDTQSTNGESETNDAVKAASLAAAARSAVETQSQSNQGNGSPSETGSPFNRRSATETQDNSDTNESPLFRRRPPTSEMPAASAGTSSPFGRPTSERSSPFARSTDVTTEDDDAETPTKTTEESLEPAPAARPRGLNFSPEDRFRRRRPGMPQQPVEATEDAEDAPDEDNGASSSAAGTAAGQLAAAAAITAASAAAVEPMNVQPATEATDYQESEDKPAKPAQSSLFGGASTATTAEDTAPDESDDKAATVSSSEKDDPAEATLTIDQSADDEDDEQASQTETAKAAAATSAAQTKSNDTAASTDEAVEETPASKSDAASTPQPAQQDDPIVVNTSERWRLADYRELLEAGSSQEIDQHLLLQRARLIEDTLESFGAPGRVVEVNTGPVITQFGVEPNYIERRGGGRSRVKVSAIAALDRDLALALAAKSIRIEAPVPGKGYVGIEVPNAESDLVSLRDVMSSPQHHKMVTKSRLTIGLGKRVDGGAVSADLTKMPHLLVAGATGSGKSVAVNAIISCLLLQNSPEDLQFIMVDPKRVELAGYNGIPHLVAPVVVDLERIVGVLKWVQREMDDRYKRFASAGARNILDYNLKIDPDQDKMPYLIVIIDELADLMMLAPDETERLIARLAQMARATGIHLIISTQRPSVDVVTGLIKANFPARIAFAVASSVDSRVILDQPGAEKLLGRGDMLYQAPDAPAPLRMQGVFVSDPEINAITQYWKSTQALARKDGKMPPKVRMGAPLPGEKRELPRMESRSDRINGKKADSDEEKDDKTPSTTPAGSGQVVTAKRDDFWKQVREVENEVGSNDDNGDESDELYNEAVELVQQRNKASISMLQRHFRIGYTRAARLIDVMESEGIVGPAESGAKPRKVLKKQSG